MIPLDINPEGRKSAVARAKEKGIYLPTIDELKHPDRIPSQIAEKLGEIPLHELHPLNLFRFHWKNRSPGAKEPFGRVNHIEIPQILTGGGARIYALTARSFPTGSLKVGPAYGALVRRMVAGHLNPATQKPLWLSMGKSARGGTYAASLMGCSSVAILPDKRREERSEWLEKTGAEVVALSTSEEDTVKEIYGHCRRIHKERSETVLINPFAEEGNYLWHYHITGKAMEEAIKNELLDYDRFSGLVLATGSAGPLACGDYLKEVMPAFRTAVVEPLQSATILQNGYGFHRIPGIGKSHIPWIHNVRNTDLAIGIDDQKCLDVFRLFQEDAGRDYLASLGLPDSEIQKLSHFGISGVCNLLASIKFSRYFELNSRNVIFTICPDWAGHYDLHLEQLRRERGEYTRDFAVRHYHSSLVNQSLDHTRELSYYEKKRIHNLKYFTWVEQEGKNPRELESQWYDYPDYWQKIQEQVVKLDGLIREFNSETGLG